MHIATLLLSALLCFPQTPDTLDVARISADRSAAATSATPLQRVDASEIERRGARGLEEVLRTFSGVTVKDYGGVGGLKTVSIRSLGAQHTSFVYDGNVVSDAQTGQVDISRFDLDGIGEVKVVVAGSDDIFRSARAAAGAGTVFLSSTAPKMDSVKTTATAKLTAGSFGLFSPYLGVARKIGGRWTASAQGSWTVSEGNYPFTLVNGQIVTKEHRLGSDVEILKGETNLRGQFRNGGRLSLKANGLSSERGLPGSVVYYTLNPIERLYDRNVFATALYEDEIGDSWRVRATGGVTATHERYTNSSALYPEPLDEHYRQQEYSLGGIVLKSMGNFEVSLAEDVWAGKLATTLEACPFPTRLSSETALSAKYRYSGLTVTATLLGLLQHEWVESGDAADPLHRLLPEMNVSWVVPGRSGIRLRASFKEGLRVPTFNDLYYSRIGNTALSPEKARQVGGGIVWAGEFGRFSLSASDDAYFNRVRDKIVATPTMFVWRMRNVGLVNILGNDLNVRAEWSGGRISIKGGANWSYCHAANVTDPEAKNYRHQIAYTPRNSGSADLGVDTPWFRLGYVVTAVGERWYLDQNTASSRIAPYADHSLSLSRSFALGARPRLLLSAQAMNLGNNNYEVIRNYPMPGFNWRITIKVTY